MPEIRFTMQTNAQVGQVVVLNPVTGMLVAECKTELQWIQAGICPLHRLSLVDGRCPTTPAFVNTSGHPICGFDLGVWDGHESVRCQVELPCRVHGR